MMMRKDRCFIAITFLTSVILFAFVFWLGFPGYFQTGNIYNSIALLTDNWDPVFISFFLKVLYALFGKHSFYLFALNIVCFYAGLFFYITALYLRTKNSVWYALFCITAIGNLFFQNFVSYNTFALPMLLWLGCSLVFFQLVVEIKPCFIALIIKGVTCIVFLFSLLWRHNAILSVYPLFLLFIYLFLENRKGVLGRAYIFRFVSLMLFSGAALACIVLISPYLFSNNLSNTTTNHIFLHQIAGMTVPADDPSLIPQEWYENGKDFEDVKAIYQKEPLFADPLNVPWEPYDSSRPFKRDLSGLQMIWLKGLFTYPVNWSKHIMRFYKKMWFQNAGWFLSPYRMQESPLPLWHVYVASQFPENERYISFTPFRKKMYKLLYNHRIVLNHIVGITIGFCVLLVSGCFWVMVPAFREPMLLFSVSTSLSSFCSAVTIPMFSPTADPRYLSLVLVLSLISVIGFIAWSPMASGRHSSTVEKKSKIV